MCFVINMNLLPRWSLDKPNDGREGRERAAGRSVSAERQQDGDKPSLLRRLSRRTSRSAERPSQKRDEPQLSLPGQVSGWCLLLRWPSLERCAGIRLIKCVGPNWATRSH